MTPDLVVVGGGPVGLAAAIAARQRGLEVLLADKSRPPIDKPCGEGVMPEGVSALRALGVQVDSKDATALFWHPLYRGGSIRGGLFSRGGGTWPRYSSPRPPSNAGPSGCGSWRRHALGGACYRPEQRGRSDSRTKCAMSMDCGSGWPGITASGDGQDFNRLHRAYGAESGCGSISGRGRGPILSKSIGTTWGRRW